jgi:hypothetical protein
MSTFGLMPSCRSKLKYPYAISDFKRDWQHHLVSIVNAGNYNDDQASRFVREKFSNADLQKLAYSEHPLLRVAALRTLLDRPETDHFSLVMSHLDDTAIVTVDLGEFGYDRFAVTDDMLSYASWQTQESLQKTIDQVITKHNYLHSDYIILSSREFSESHYPFIKDMAGRNIRFDDV